ncbi:MAG: ABC transporter substrate-binding protein [Candidatus Caldarchaeum sp.]
MRITSLLILIGHLFLLSSCTPRSAQETSTALVRRWHIGISIPAADHGWTAGVKWWAEQAMKLYPNVEWTLSTAKNSEQQIADIETMMVKGVDALVILATESAPLTPIAKKVKSQGILLISVDRGFIEPVADVFIEGDNKAFGRKSAEYIVNRLNEKGNIVILRGIPSTVDTDRFESAMSVFRNFPDIKILDVQMGEWNRQRAYEVMQTILVKHKKIDAVWAADDDMALGAEQAIREAGRQNEMWLIGGGGMKEVVKKIMERDPMYPATITYPPSMIAIGIHEAVSILRDGKKAEILKFMPRHLVMDVEVVTPDNAQRYYFPDSIY